MKEHRAEEIAAKLNDTTKWKTHGRGLSRKVIENDLNLIIEDFAADMQLNNLVRSYYRLLQNYMLQNNHEFVVHVPKSYFGL